MILPGGARMIAAITIAALGVFFVLSILTQVSRVLSSAPAPSSPTFWRRLLLGNRIWNRWRAIPVFTFFAYVPEREIQLLFRDRLYDQQLTSWKKLYYERNEILKWVWNPDRRRQKAALDLTSGLLTLLSQEKDISFPTLFSSAAYRKLATYVSGLPRTGLTEERQFMIAITPIPDADQPPQILFISPMHPISSGVQHG
jgi:hypothetical protein